MSYRISIANLASRQVADLAIAKKAAQFTYTPMTTGKRQQGLPDDMRPSAIGRRLQIIREAHGFTKSEIADRLEIDRTHWSRFEGGQRAMPYDKAARLCSCFGITLDYLILGCTETLSFEVREKLRSVEDSL